jgi:hypothetical protein
MFHPRRAWLFALLYTVAFADAHGETRATQRVASATPPVTTRATPARKHFDDALQELRLSTKADPDFTQAQQP